MRPARLVRTAAARLRGHHPESRGDGLDRLELVRRQDQRLACGLVGGGEDGPIARIEPVAVRLAENPVAALHVADRAGLDDPQGKRPAVHFAETKGPGRERLDVGEVRACPLDSLDGTRRLLAVAGDTGDSRDARLLPGIGDLAGHYTSSISSARSWAARSANRTGLPWPVAYRISPAVDSPK